MGRKDLSGYDGMIFRWAQDVQLSFWMRTVPTGLSIAWFASDGARAAMSSTLVSAARSGNEDISRLTSRRRAASPIMHRRGTGPGRA